MTDISPPTENIMMELYGLKRKRSDSMDTQCSDSDYSAWRRDDLRIEIPEPNFIDNVIQQSPRYANRSAITIQRYYRGYHVRLTFLV